MLSPESRADVRFDALRRQVSLARIIAKSAESRFHDGPEGTYLQETARRAGRVYDQTRPLLDWEMFCNRADTVAVAAQGGYLVGTTTTAAADALRPVTVAVALGATVVDAVGPNLVMPQQNTTATAYWLGSETSQASPTSQAFGQLAMLPKTVGAYTEASRQLLLQSNADQIIARDLLSVVGREIDRAALHGTGINGQPIGITKTAGVGSFSGTTLAGAGIVDAFVGLGDGLGTNGGVAANRTVAGTLRKRAEISGSGFTTWQGSLTDGTVVGYKARSSTAVASGALIVGSWEYLMLPIWGGVEIEVNPYAADQTQFQKGLVGIRCFVSTDVGIIYPGAFSVAATVT